MITNDHINKILIIAQYIIPRFSENVQEWHKDRVINAGFLYVVKKNYKIQQAFFEVDAAYMNEARLKRLFNKIKLLNDLEFHLVIVNNRWRIGWKDNN